MNADGLPVARYPAARLHIENWLEHRIYFSDTPLAEALSEMNRYNPVPIRLSDRMLETIKVSVFSTLAIPIISSWPCKSYTA
jgi:ferric-dicitrate binding protein FerR (iron transport regulator)